MKRQYWTAIALGLVLGATTAACGGDDGQDGTNNSVVDTGSDAGAGDAAVDDTGTDTHGQTDGGDVRVEDGGDTADTADTGDDGGDLGDAGLDVGDAGIDGADTGDAADTGDTSPPPDDLDPLNGHWSTNYSVPGVVSSNGGEVNALLKDDASGTIYVGGAFEYAGTAEAANIAMWTGNAWQSMGNGIDIGVNALASDAAGTLYAAGSGGGGGGFGIPSPNEIKSWDGSQWSTFAEVTSSFSKVYDMVVLTNGDMIVAGQFDGVGGTTSANLIRYTGSAWEAIDPANQPDGAVYDVAPTANGFCIGGSFSNVGSTAANKAACWDGASWSALGNGLDSDVHALMALGGGKFLAGGQFAIQTSPTPTFAVGLAKFDGASWNPYAGGVHGGSVTDVRMLQEGDNGQIYVGGTFSAVGANYKSSANIARLDGTTWTAMGTGVHEGSRITAGSVVGVNDLVVIDDAVLAGGFFTNASTTFAPNLASYTANGRWETFVNSDDPYLGADGLVSAFASAPNGHMYAAGWFDNIGPSGSAGVAEFNGTTWTRVGQGLPGGRVHAITVDSSGALYAGGEFQYAGPNVVSWIAKWDGSQWSPVGYGVNGAVYDLAAGPNGNVYAVGQFTLADGQAAGGVAKWDGSSWQTMDAGLANVGDGADQEEIDAVEVGPSGTVYVGGTFVRNNSFTVVKHLAKWNGTTWVEVGGGVEDHRSNTTGVDDNARVNVLDFWGAKLVVGGNFAKSGGMTTNSIALWDGANWSALANGITPTFSGGRPGGVYGIATKQNGLFIAIDSEDIDGQDVGFVGWWDGSSWSGLGDGVADVAEAVGVYDHSLFVGGPFIGAAGYPSFHVARWNYQPSATP